MRFILLLLLSLFAFSTQAQENYQRSFLRLGISVSPNINTTHLRRNNSMWRETWNDHTRPAFGYNAGILLNLEASSFVEFQFGIEYSRRANKVVDFPVMEYFKEGLVDGLLNESTKTDNLDLPVGVNYFFLNRDIRLAFRAGMILSIFMGGHYSARYEFENGVVRERENNSGSTEASTLDLGYYVGLGVEFMDLGPYLLRVEPTFRKYYSKGNVVSVESVERSIGAQMVLIKKLR